eukprot:Protomagalhaensia_wolfi_Nauph_80__5023@NODE_5320_length_408_cov_1807_644986_g4372_i0_p1_GENE_NODE_5320_length_408_cov_1807_644986_g4372_i0NODE_5320_length_408_cov_1807_644986_g4372_i0_p1_ORF_typecomplete_len106_score10_38DUF4209/PF13910_6/0_0015SPATA25/PF15218_6/0_062_NODE_5320_length_408_cov_1807_644986_g4372_i064381
MTDINTEPLRNDPPAPTTPLNGTLAENIHHQYLNQPSWRNLRNKINHGFCSLRDCSSCGWSSGTGRSHGHHCTSNVFRRAACEGVMAEAIVCPKTRVPSGKLSRL